ncbi:hypothetical protein [Thiospirochaeta perfilievii]|uniref:hypothetical protein n=1 Tax=Thiospirochaeta perfilievii TaxID=252967 RepID=UPI0011F0C137|nr:hypothetical protein [Thiospirochaeta perfilievii]
MRLIKLEYIVILLLSILSCNLDKGATVEPIGEIIFPSNEASYNNGQFISFKASSNSSNISWYDKNGEILSTEKAFIVEASEVLSDVEIRMGTLVLDRIKLNIEDGSLANTYIITNKKMDIPLGSMELGYFISLGPEIMNFDLSLSLNNKSTNNRSFRDIRSIGNTFIKDVNLTFNRSAKIINKRNSNLSRSINNKTYLIGDKKISL